MKLLLIDNTDPGDEHFNNPLYKVLKPLIEFDTLRYSTISPGDAPAEGYDGIILTGVPLKYPLETIEERRNFMDWVPEVSVPVLGICIGHQSLGVLFGSSTLKKVEAENGEFEIEKIEDDPILKNISNPFKAELLHSCSIILPENFKRIARSKKCSNQIMKHMEKDIYGFQFHPELSETGLSLLKNFIEIIKKSKNYE